MGSIWFDPEMLADHLHEIIGYKAGVVASIPHICDLLSGSEYPDLIRASESSVVRVRSEDYEELYFSLLHAVGTTAERFHPIAEMVRLTLWLEKLGGEGFGSVIMAMMDEGMRKGRQAAKAEGRATIDPRDMVIEAEQAYGAVGREGMIALLEMHARNQRYSPYTERFEVWKNLQPLQELFERTGTGPEYGTFLDQRLIDYLSVHGEQLGTIHWRRFEELTAEYFTREGFEVELGPGGNDDGVDVRAWRGSAEPGAATQYLIQCKRQQAKIDKVTVKGLYADVLNEQADLGLLVTSSEFSPGARETVAARGYPVQEVNGDHVRGWLAQLRTPGTGILRP